MEVDNRSYKTGATTRGGMSFDQLCRGDQLPSYVCDRECLVDILREDTLEEAEKKLVTKIDTLFKDIEIQKEATIDKFYIGKTYVITRKHSSMDPLNPWTWRKEGISSRWGEHKKTDYGKDGMIVIAVITRNRVALARDANGDAVERGNVLGQELYTLALEQRLLHYYMIKRGDARIDNKTFTSGGIERTSKAGYVLYVAFSLGENKDNSYIQNETREDESVEIDPNESNQVMDTNTLQHTPLVQPQSTVSLAQSTSVPLPQSIVSIAQSTLPMVLPLLDNDENYSNTICEWLDTLPGNNNNECLEEDQREYNTIESRLASIEQETHQNTADIGNGIQTNVSDLGNTQPYGERARNCPAHNKQLSPVNEDDDDDCVITGISQHNSLKEKSFSLLKSDYINDIKKISNLRPIEHTAGEFSTSSDGIQQTETTPNRLNPLSLRNNRKRKYMYAWTKASQEKSIRKLFHDSDDDL